LIIAADAVLDGSGGVTSPAASASAPPAPPQSLYPAGAGAGRGAVRTALRSAGMMSGPYSEGVQRAYTERYLADLARLAARPDLPSAARWVDSHCHLESILQRTWRGGGKPQVTEVEPDVNLQELVASWPKGLDGCITNHAFKRPSKPGNPSEFAWIQKNLPFFAAGDQVGAKLWFTMGLHPHDAANWDDDTEALVRRLAKHPRCVGIGECGLDFFKHDKSEAERQLNTFRAQARLAVELKKALVVHARLVTPENEALCATVFSELVPRDHPVHLHCYGDSLEFALQLCDTYPNLRIGFTGAITFRDKPDKGKGKGKAKGKGGVVEKKGEAHCRELVQGLPLDRLLIETDGPYMCPEPFRGQTAHPGHVHRVAERIAAWRECSLGDVMAATRQSTSVVYGI